MSKPTSSSPVVSPDSSPTPSSKLAWSSVVSSLPSEPGVYWFIGQNDQILYVGKAKNLRNRVRSYTQIPRLLDRTKKLVHQALELKHQVLESELEALLVEAELIRTHQPPFNVLLKDDKTPLYITITKEEFPRVLLVRKKETQQLTHIPGTTLGPFPSAYKTKEVLRLARKIFPWCSQPQNHGRPCFYYHLELCPGACVGAVDATTYRTTIKHLQLFLQGKKKGVVAALKQEMQRASQEEAYEKAGDYRDQIALITSVTSGNYHLQPDLALPRLKESLAAEQIIYLQKVLHEYGHFPKQFPLQRIETYDVSNISGTDAAVAMVVGIDGRPDTSHYRVFNIKSLDTPNDYAMLQEALTRRQSHPEWGTPNLVVIDGGKGQVQAVSRIWHWNVPVIGIAKDPDRLIIPISIDAKTSLREVKLPEGHLGLKVIQQLRDEAHRFSKKQHHRRHQRRMLSREN